MTDTTMQLLSQGTDHVKVPDFDILAEGKTLSGVAERLMSLSLTDNRGFEADQLTITLDDADGQLQLPPRGAPDGSHWLERRTADRKRHL